MVLLDVVQPYGPLQIWRSLFQGSHLAAAYKTAIKLNFHRFKIKNTVHAQGQSHPHAIKDGL